MKCVLCGGEAYIAAFDAEDAICDKCQKQAWKRNKKESRRLKQISGKIGNDALQKLKASQ